MLPHFKVIFLILHCFLQISPLFAQGVWEIEQASLNLGTIVANEQPQTITLSLKNNGDQPILIKQVTPMTPVLKMNWSRIPIQSKETTHIQATFIPHQLSPGRFNYTIFVYSNAKNKRLELNLSGHLIDNPKKPELLYKQNINGLKFKSRHIALGNVYSWQTITDTIYFINKRNETVELSMLSQPIHIETHFHPKQVANEEKGAIILTYHGLKKKEYGYSYESLIFSTNYEINYSNQLQISSTLLEDFNQLTPEKLTQAPIAFFETKEYDFGTLEQGIKKSCDFQLTNKGKTPLHIRTTKTSCGCTIIKLTDKVVLPGQTLPIQIIFDSTGKMGFQNKTVTIITNDPKNPETTLRIKGEIR